ncbi:hypothetical protein BV25DRAFT_1915879 [Artomyces pyxidatus]|uniref:Uncharacterized protein n=1 Tax=Artomyces pyxidatus TaxID=48021 RepID=A0ACB8T435_9AGAM|nr:hypothetical protein BV25DRAFT_1915879 [Artomyces pyxidatus]
MFALTTGSVAIEKRAGRLGGSWTTQHGFFVIMGGFHYYDDGEPKYPLSRWAVANLGDSLSKALAVVQTLWFIVQCIARCAQGLPITQLEVMTLAYTVITVAMYAAWWAKPQNVSCPVRVAVKDIPKPEEPREVEQWSERMFSMIGGWQDTFVDLRKEPCVPTFYGGSTKEGSNDVYADVIALGAAMVFGVVHCVAWNYTFPSSAEELIWRISSIAIITIPGALMFFVTGIAMDIEDSNRTVVFAFFVVAAAFVVFLLSGPTYVAARIFFFALSSSTLRSLPPPAYQAVQWTLLIPHFSYSCLSEASI